MSRTLESLSITHLIEQDNWPYTAVDHVIGFLKDKSWITNIQEVVVVINGKDYEAVRFRDEENGTWNLVYLNNNGEGIDHVPGEEVLSVKST
jgi:hypothetical protein